MGNDHERLVLLEQTVKEMERQMKACWERMDQRNKELEEMRLIQVRTEAHLEQKIHNVETNGEKSILRFHGRVDKLQWKIGLIVAVLLGIFNYFLNLVDFNKVFGVDKTPTVTTSRRP